MVDAGGTVVVVEHNLDLISAADWIVDLGPEAADDGGRIVVEGPPAVVMACSDSHTGRHLLRHRDSAARDPATGAA